MNHINKIIDADPHFTIDPISRRIRNESSKKVTLIQGDHNSERFSFELPRFVEGHDMLECNRVEVHFINIENGTGNRHEDMFDVKDMQTLPDNPEHVAFSWLITDNATKYVGSLAFGIRFCCTDTDNVADYVWKTAVNKDIKISEGMNTAESVDEAIPDIIAQWEERIFEDAGNAVENINMAKEEALEALRKAGAGGIVVDSELDETSENPVQNKVVTTAFAGLGDTIQRITRRIPDINLEYRAQALGNVTSTGIYKVEYVNAKSGEVINGLNDILIVVRGKTDSNYDTRQYLYNAHAEIKYRCLYEEETLTWSDWLDLYIVEQEFDPYSVYSQSGQAISAYVDQKIGDITQLDETILDNEDNPTTNLIDAVNVCWQYIKYNSIDVANLDDRVAKINEEINSIVTALDNVITKYGLGGDVS